jgi:hypothetical protein
LIAIDSPFQQEPPITGLSLLTLAEENLPEPDFSVIWDSLVGYNARGWCDLSMEDAVHHLELLELSLKVLPIDQTPFKGEFIVTRLRRKKHTI